MDAAMVTFVVIAEDEKVSTEYEFYEGMNDYCSGLPIPEAHGARRNGWEQAQEDEAVRLDEQDIRWGLI